MGLLRKKVAVPPNSIGYLFKKNRLYKRLEPGIYYYFDFKWQLNAVVFSTLEQLVTVTNQEVITKDNISLRLSYLVEYQIIDSDRLISKFDLFAKYPSLVQRIESLVHNLSQIYLRDAIASIDSQELNQQRAEVLTQIPEALQAKLSQYGITVHQLAIRDIFFPKAIQKLFAQELASKIRAKTDLENARTAVATARTLKNMAKLMEKDPNIRFLQWLETVSKIAQQGNHTFHLGEVDTSAGYSEVVKEEFSD